MKKTEKLLKDLSRLEVGCAPSAGYFEKIILSAREALIEFNQKVNEFQNFKTNGKTKCNN